MTVPPADLRVTVPLHVVPSVAAVGRAFAVFGELGIVPLSVVLGVVLDVLALLLVLLADQVRVAVVADLVVRVLVWRVVHVAAVCGAILVSSVIFLMSSVLVLLAYALQSDGSRHMTALVADVGRVL